MSAFLSMWISNTAASAMMMPITKALLQRLYADEIASDGETETETRNKENNDKYEKEAAAFGNQDEKDVVDKSAKSEGVVNVNKDRSKNNKLDILLHKN